jgi:hypothetical protein
MRQYLLGGYGGAMEASETNLESVISTKTSQGKWEADRLFERPFVFF